MSQQNMDTGFLVAQLKKEKNQVEQMKLLTQLQSLTNITRVRELARKFGLDLNMVYRAMNLLGLSSQVLRLVEAGDATGKKLTLAAAQIIARQHVSKQLDLAERVMAEGISASALRRMLTRERIKMSGGILPPSSTPECSPQKEEGECLREIIGTLVAAEQTLSRLRTYTWEEFRSAFHNKEEIENLRRLLAYIGLRTGEFDEMLNVVLRTKFQ